MLINRDQPIFSKVLVFNVKVVCGVEWLESEAGWGRRPEGWKLFLDLDECLESTKLSSATGCCDGGYIGPVRPLSYYEIPFDSLESNLQEKLTESRMCFTDFYWVPRFCGPCKSITSEGDRQCNKQDGA